MNLDKSSLLIFSIFLSHAGLRRTYLYPISNINPFINICAASLIIYHIIYHFIFLLVSRFAELGRSVQYVTHKTRSQIHTLKCVQDTLPGGRASTLEGYTHAHTYTHNGSYLDHQIFLCMPLGSISDYSKLKQTALYRLHIYHSLLRKMAHYFRNCLLLTVIMYCSNNGKRKISVASLGPSKTSVMLLFCQNN